MTQTILITGASRGLGAAAARMAAELGANVVLNARSAVSLEAAAESIRGAGGSALAAPGDVSREEDCRRLVETAVARFGRLDGLVNNAGVLQPVARIADADPGEWRRNWAVNLLGPLMLTQAALPHLRASRGRVINVSSGAAVSAVAGWGAYCVAKAALNQFNRLLAVEEERITAVALRPGVFDTEMQATIRREGGQGMTAEQHARFIQLHAEGKLPPPEIPGRALAVLALFAPHEWSGEFIQWDEARVQALVEARSVNRG